MSHYTTDKCFTCGNKMIKPHNAEYFHCTNEKCGYEIQTGVSVSLKFTIDSYYYEVWIRYPSDIYPGSTTIHKYEVDQDNIYTQDQALELSPEEWINLIKRIERAQVFK